MTGKQRLITIIAGCCLLVVTGVGVGLWYRQHSQPSEPAPVLELDSDDYTDDGSLKKSSVPSGEQILAALRSDDRKAIASAYGPLLAIVTDDEDMERLWSDDLSKKYVYDQIRRHLESKDIEVFGAALSAVDPRYEFGINFYQSKKDIKRVRQAIKRYNERECDKGSDSWSCLELVLNEEGEPVKIEYSGGGSDH